MATIEQQVAEEAMTLQVGKAGQWPVMVECLTYAKESEL
jgi:hypothetical protein